MPRNRERKTSIGLHTEEQMRNAVKLMSDGQKITAVARTTRIPYTTLNRLTIMDVRPLIYEVAMLNNIKLSEKWHKTKLASIEYLYNRLSLRNPEGCSLSRATCYIISALGNALPPVIIFARVHFMQHMIADAPAGTLSLATQSGWMNSELLVTTMQHFITHTNSSKENPSLLIYDNHESHISIEAFNLAKENGVTILIVPPHSTGKLQPLDIGVFGPFKTAYNKAIASWMMRNPRQTYSIYLARCVREAHMKPMTPGNIFAAFKATGILPFGRDIFSDLDFAPNEVTDRQINLENNPNQCNRPEEHDGRVNDSNKTRSPSPSILKTSCTPTKQIIQ